MNREQAKAEIKARYAEYLQPAKKKVNGKSKALHLTEEAFKALNGMYKNLKG